MAKRPISDRIWEASRAPAARSAAALSSRPLPWSRPPRRHRAYDAGGAHCIDGRNGPVAAFALGQRGARGRLPVSRAVPDLHAARDSGGRRLRSSPRGGRGGGGGRAPGGPGGGGGGGGGARTWALGART